MCSPAKRIKTGADALDLSHKSADVPRRSSDVIVLSEDDDEKSLPVGSDTEKENAPGETNGIDHKSEELEIENELRQSEAVLQLLHKLQDSQTPNSANNTSVALKQGSSSQSNTSSNHSVSTSTPKCTPAVQTPQRPPSASAAKVATPSIPQSSSPLSIPKVSKQAAIQALEQTAFAKRAALRKQLDRNLEKVNLPRPPPGSGLSEVAFIPSTVSGDFTSLLGLEEVVKSIQDFDVSNANKSSEQRISFKPFLCVKCGTDYTPVWKREKPDSSNVICEACLASTQRLTLKKEYDDAVDSIMQQHNAAEREVDREYQEIVGNPAKLDAYVKEQEKKLLASQQLQFAQQAAFNQRFNTKASTNVAASGLRQSPSAVVGGTSVAAAAHQRSRASAGNVTAATIPTASAAQVAAATHMALQYAKAMNSPANANTAAALMMSALANSQQQQQQVAAALHQQQQRLIAAQLLQSLQVQQQQQQQQVATPATDQVSTLSQLQALLVGNCLIGGAGGVQNANARVHLLQTMQYLLMQQQQQQQQQQVQAQAAQQAAQAAQAAQQGAALQQLFSHIQSNPAYLSFMQHLWTNNNANNNSGGGAGSANNNQSGAASNRK